MKKQIVPVSVLDAEDIEPKIRKLLMENKKTAFSIKAIARETYGNASSEEDAQKRERIRNIIRKMVKAGEVIHGRKTGPTIFYAWAQEQALDTQSPRQ